MKRPVGKPLETSPQRALRELIGADAKRQNARIQGVFRRRMRQWAIQAGMAGDHPSAIAFRLAGLLGVELLLPAIQALPLDGPDSVGMTWIAAFLRNLEAGIRARCKKVVRFKLMFDGDIPEGGGPRIVGLNGKPVR